MNNILIIAKNTIKETLRDKILYAILAFALLFLISTTLFGSISLGEDIKVIKDFGLAGIYIFSLIITIFLGTSLIYKEIEKRTIYIILSKPVSTEQFLIGRFLGLFLSIVLNVILMTLIYLVIVAVKGGGFDSLSLYSSLLLSFELSIFISLTILFSTITTPLAGTIYSIIFLYIGHSLDLIKKYAEKSGGFYNGIVSIAYWILPNLDKFNIKNSVVHGVSPSSSQIIYPIIYSLCFSAVLIFLANLSLKNQDL